MAVVGLDFGNLSVLIGQAGRGGVDVILNDSSNRQTASYVSIQGKQRFLGDSGSAMVSNRNGDCNDTSSHDSQITPWHFVDTFPDQLRYRHSIQTVSDLYRQHLMQFTTRVNTSTWSNPISRQGQTLPTRFTAWNNSWDGNLIPQMFRKVGNNSSFISWCISGRVSQRWLNDMIMLAVFVNHYWKETMYFLRRRCELVPICVTTHFVTVSALITLLPSRYRIIASTFQGWKAS